MSLFMNEVSDKSEEELEEPSLLPMASVVDTSILPPPIESIHVSTNVYELESLDVPYSLSPHQYEQTARELLIERERQSRLERERARLKRHLALSRDRHDEESEEKQNGTMDDYGSLHLETEFSGEAFVIRANSVLHGSEIGDNKSADCTVGDASEIISSHLSQDENICDHNPLGYVMERFLSDNLVNANDFDGDISRFVDEPIHSIILNRNSSHFLDHATESRPTPLLPREAETDIINSRFKENEEGPSSRVASEENLQQDNDYFVEHENTTKSSDDVNEDDINDGIDGRIMAYDVSDEGGEVQSDFQSHVRSEDMSDIDDNNIDDMTSPSVRDENVPPYPASFSSFAYEAIFSEGTQTTVLETLSAVSQRDCHAVDTHTYFDGVNDDHLEESNSVASNTSVLANVSVHSDESNIALSVPIIRPNPVDGMISVSSVVMNLPLSASFNSLGETSHHSNLMNISDHGSHEDELSAHSGTLSKISVPFPHIKMATEPVISQKSSCTDETARKQTDDNSRSLLLEAFAITFVERIFTILVTVIIEAPVFMTIWRGSDKLRDMLGHSKFQLIISILPLSTAITRIYGYDVGQSLSKKATATCAKNDSGFFVMELGVLSFISLCVGTIFGLLSYFTAFDSTFGLAIGVSISFQLLVGGLLALASPLFYHNVLRRSSGKWDRIVNYAVQDILGCFTMIFFCYHVLLQLNPVYP